MKNTRLLSLILKEIEFSIYVGTGCDDVLSNGSKDEIQRVTEAFFKMKKFDLDTLEKVRLGINQ